MQLDIDNVIVFQANAASAGLIRTPNLQTIVSSRNAANTQNIDSLRIDGADQLIFGSATQSTGSIYDAPSTRSHVFRVNGATEFTMDAVALTIFSGNFLAFNNNPATQGHIRGPNGFTVSGRNAANSANIDMLTLGGDNVVYLGATNAQEVDVHTSSFFDINVASTLEHRFSSSAYDTTGNVIVFGPNTATAGFLRLPANAQYLVSRNLANTLNMVLVSQDSANSVIFGDDTSVPKLVHRVATAGTYEYLVNNVMEWVFDATGLNAQANNVTNVGFLSFVSPAAQGTVRGGTSFSMFGLQSSSDRALMDWSSGTLRLGDASNSSTQLRGSSRTFTLSTNSFDLDNGWNVFTFGSTTVTTASDQNTNEFTFKGRNKSGNTSTLGGSAFVAGGDVTGSGGLHRGGWGGVLGGNATGSSGARTGGSVWLGPGTGANVNGNVYVGTTNPESGPFNFQGMGSGIAIQDRTSAPSTALSGASALWSDTGVLRTFTAFGLTAGTLPSTGFLRIPDGNNDIIVVRSTSDRSVMAFSTAGPTVILGGTSCDTRIDSEHVLSGRLGATTVWTFEDDGDNAITPLNIGDASGKLFTIRAPGSTASNNPGGTLVLMGGRRAGTGVFGGVRLELNVNDSSTIPVVQVAAPSGGSVAALCYPGALTSTQMPSNTGDGVLFFGHATTRPTANPSSDGLILYGDALRNNLRARSEHGGIDSLNWEQQSTFQANVHHYKTARFALADDSEDQTAATFDLTTLISGSGDVTVTVICEMQARATDGSTEGWVRIVNVARTSGTWDIDPPGSSGTLVHNNAADLDFSGFDISPSSGVFEVLMDTLTSAKTWSVNFFITFKLYSL
jgi:hypothetical protein